MRFRHSRLKGINRAAIAVLLATAVVPAWGAAPNLPDPARTPGASDSTVLASNYRQELCSGANRKKYHTTDEKRPSSSFTTSLKKKQLKEWGYTDKRVGDYEEDHLISLELGGDPSSPDNLWPQRYGGKWGARVKDTLETELGARVCLAETEADYVPLPEARNAVAQDWIAAYKKYVCGRTRSPLTAKMKAQCKLP